MKALLKRAFFWILSISLAAAMIPMGVFAAEETATVDIYAEADTYVSFWNTDKGINYGGSHYIAVQNTSNTTANGVFGEKYNATGTDGKIGFVKFDVSKYKEAALEGKVLKAELILTYHGKRNNATALNNTIKVTDCPDWIEGNGGDKGMNPANNVDGAITFNNKPGFDSAAPGKIIEQSAQYDLGNPSSTFFTDKYMENNVAINGEKVTTDVTGLFKNIDFNNAGASKYILSLAFNETAGSASEHYFVSNECVNDRPGVAAEDMRPTLRLTVAGATEEPPENPNGKWHGDIYLYRETPAYREATRGGSISANNGVAGTQSSSYYGPSARYSSLKANGVEVPVIRYNSRNQGNMDVARFVSTGGTPELKITANTDINSVRIHPEMYYREGSYEISPDKRTLTFSMAPELRYVVLQINDSSPFLAVINDPPEAEGKIPDKNAENVLNIMEYVTDNTGVTDQAANFKKALDELYSNDKYDTLYIPDGYYLYAGFEIRGTENERKSKPVTIYTEEGALLQNWLQDKKGPVMEPAIGIWYADNVTFRGRGIFDGNGLQNHDIWRKDAASSNHQGGVMVVHSTNINFEDTYLRDSKQWNWETHTAKDCTFTNIKGLSPYNHAWIDGVNLASGQNITVNGALTLGNDDVFASGHYNPDDGYLESAGNTHVPHRLAWDTAITFNINVKNHLGWSYGAGQGVRVGTGAGHPYELGDYTFENCHGVNFSAGGTGIALNEPSRKPDGVSPSEYIRNAFSFTNCSYDTSRVGVNIRATGHAATGGINDVKLINCWFSHERSSPIQNVGTFEVKNMHIAGSRVWTLGNSKITTGNVVKFDHDFVDNNLPVIEQLDDITLYAGDDVEFAVEATDKDGDGLTYTTAEPLPEGAGLDEKTGAFSWTPQESQIGMHHIKFIVSDQYESATMSMVITVISASSEIINLYVKEDAHVQSWDANERSRTYGGSEHLRTRFSGNTAHGAFGENFITGSSVDFKTSLLKFDISDFKAQLGEKDYVAVLTLTYIGRRNAGDTGDDTVKVRAVSKEWIEGNGKNTPSYNAGNVAGSATWDNSRNIFSVPANPIVKESAPFKVDRLSTTFPQDAGYSANTAIDGTRVRVDVTDIIKAMDPSEDILSMAFCETKAFELGFISREGSLRYNNATEDMQPTLAVTVNAEPAIAGPEAMELAVGYEATSTKKFIAVGVGDFTITKKSGDDKITWNETTQRLDIAAGLGAGRYPVELESLRDGEVVASFTFTLIVTAAPVIITESLPGGTVGEDYGAMLQADGDEPITWSIVGGELPEGLSLDPETGEISGTPETAGTFGFTVKAKNDTGSDTAELSITIEEVEVTSVKIDGAAIQQVRIRNKKQFTATINPADATDKTLEWTSSNEKIFTVDGDGLVTGLGTGSAKLIVTAANGVTSFIMVQVTA